MNTNFCIYIVSFRAWRAEMHVLSLPHHFCNSIHRPQNVWTILKPANLFCPHRFACWNLVAACTDKKQQLRPTNFATGHKRSFGGVNT